MTTLRSKYHHPHLTDADTEAQLGGGGEMGRGFLGPCRTDSFHYMCLLSLDRGVLGCEVGPPARACLISTAGKSSDLG